MRFRSLAVLLALIAAPAQAQAPQPQRPPIRAATPCDLAAVLLKELAEAEGAGGLIYDAEPKRPMPVRGARRDEPPPGVPADLVQRWNTSGPVDLLQACPAVAAALPDGVRLATDAQRAAVSGARHAEYLHSISAPIANLAGDHVLIAISNRCAGLCGGGAVYHFQKTRRGWIELPPVGLWMS